MVDAKEVWAGGEQGRDAASRATQPPSVPHPQQPSPNGSSLCWQEAKGGLQSHGQEGWVLGDTHGITGEASPRLPAPSALPALDPRSLHPAGYHHFAVPQHPGVAVSLQLASSSTGGGRRTGWAVWEGHFSLARRFPVSKLSLQRPGCCACGQHYRGSGGNRRWAPPGYWPLATSHWPAHCGAEGMEAPGAGLSAWHVGSARGWLAGSNGRGRFPSPARSSRQRSGDIRVAGAGAARSAAPRQLLLQLRSLASFLGSPAATVSKPRDPCSAATSHLHVIRQPWLPTAQSP